MNIVQNFTPMVTIANITVPLEGKYFLLYASTSGSALYDTLTNKDGTKYVVPTGKTLRLIAVRAHSASAACSVFIGKASASANNGSVPTGYASIMNGNLQIKANTDVNPVHESILNLTVAAGYYPCVRNADTAANEVFLCEEY